MYQNKTTLTSVVVQPQSKVGVRFWGLSQIALDVTLNQLNRPLRAIVGTVLIYVGCSNSRLPKPGSQKYAELCSAFYLGLAGLQSGEDVRAREYLTRSTQIAPDEPAGWADLGILQVRQQQFDAAFKSVDKARSLAPSESRTEALLGLIENRRGNLPQAASHLTKAAKLDRHNLKALYALAELKQQEVSPESQSAAQELLKQILEQAPSNAAVLLDDVRLAAKRGDSAEAQRTLKVLQPLAAKWPNAARQQFATVQQLVNRGNVRSAAVQVQFLRNVLLRVPTYREDLDQIRTAPTLVAQPFTRFLRLASPSSEPATPDMRTHFDSEKSLGTGPVSWTGAIFLDNQNATGAWADLRHFTSTMARR